MTDQDGAQFSNNIKLALGSQLFELIAAQTQSQAKDARISELEAALAKAEKKSALKAD